MEMNTGILRDVHADEYGFAITDLTVAALIKAYLQTMKVEVVPEELRRIVSPEMRELRGGSVIGDGWQRNSGEGSTGMLWRR